MDGNILLFVGWFLIEWVVKIRPLMDGNDNKIFELPELKEVKIRPLMDGNLFNVLRFLKCFS